MKNKTARHEIRDNARIDSAIASALKEDIGRGDITSDAVIPESSMSRAVLTAKENFILAGMSFAEKIFKLACSSLTFSHVQKDGDRVKKGTVIAEIAGSTRGMLSGERTALNMLQRLSGIATITARYTALVRGLPVKITDTRKTTPGLRLFEKYAVGVGGGNNHRFGLYDGILIKDNHIAAGGGIEKAVGLVQKKYGHRLPIEVEAGNIGEVKSALKAGADVIMLDNMSIRQVTAAVGLIRLSGPEVFIEVSGNITLDNVRSFAETGPDFISIGALTHSASSVDIGMDMK
jgi:nicotinate-nucleotide pyrophosphorylase (carboxylating)